MLACASALRLPTFEVESMTLLKRLTLIIVDGRVAKVFYPVFPPDKMLQMWWPGWQSTIVTRAPSIKGWCICSWK
jgi:hypothetical protein